MDTPRDRKNYIDRVIQYLTKDGLYHLPSAEFLIETLTGENYIIFYYMLKLGEKNLALNKDFLETGMAVNKLDWINPYSIFMRDNPKITKEYLQSKTDRRLDMDRDYADALESLVLLRFDQIMRADPITDEREFLEMLNELRDIASMIFSKKVSMELQPLIVGEKEYLYLDGIRYGKSDALQYMVKRSQMLNYKLSTRSNIGANKYHVWEKTSKNTMSLVPTFIWNLGKSIFTNPQPGFLVSVIAPPKVGKTRFCIGEITYPALLLGRNVKYYTGEMEEHILRSMLITKHIKYTKGYMLEEKTVQSVMVTAARIRTNKADATELMFFERVPTNIKETVFQAEHDLFFSGKYGNLGVVHLGDTPTGSARVISDDFTIEKQHVLLREESERLSEEDKWDVVIQDHVNHMRSEKGLKEAALIEEYIQSAKAFASAEETKCVYVVVNHLNTEQEKKIEEMDTADGIKLRGHGTNESGKSADIEFVMYQTSLDKKEGTVQIRSTADRYQNITEIYQTDNFIVDADRAHCDFKFEGVGTKNPYPTVDQLEQIEEAYMSSYK